MVKLDLSDEPGDSPPFSFRIKNLGIKSCITKVKKIVSKALKGKGVNSELRLIYAHFPDQQKIIFIELYHKSDKEKKDKKRIEDNFE
ncbi:MAG: hypothetical protein EBS07_00640 [Sphingobacteriia bacterium]|nr:hypothetical protein [Sphingobacteriia bacterium]